MAQYFQVVRTDICGRVTGEVYSDPREAIKQFIYDSKRGATYPDLIFRAIGSSIVTRATYRITMVYLEKVSGVNDWNITFSCEDPKDLDLSTRRVTEGYGGRYYTDTVVYNYKTGDIIAELHQ